jgi:hypothetical protein
MDEPVTAQPSSATSPLNEPVNPPVQSSSSVGSLPIEETPEILPIPEQAASLPHTPPPAPKRSGSFLSFVGTIIVFVALFVVGVWLSSFVRQFLPGNTPNSTSSSQISGTPTPSGGAVALLNPSDPYASWKTYTVISGITKQPIAGVQYKLPETVLPPICDGVGCASQGTYLPGGTRFTIAPRGAGQALKDFRGTVISDINGTVFTTKAVVVAGHPATEFTGSFAGRTVSGYVFSKMRGVMIEISSTESLEINHFTPNGITSNFEQDEGVFDAILKTVVLPPIATTATPTPTRIATSSAGAVVPTKTPTASASGN